jgi:uncharacterized protein with GYD domain
MPNYLLNCAYSPGSWARLLRATDNRVDAAKELMESLGGSLHDVYWEVSGRSVHALADLPDSSAATAVAGVLHQSGAFKDVDVQEVLTQDQFRGSLDLAKDSAKVYRVPGQAVLDHDLSQSASPR